MDPATIRQTEQLPMYKSHQVVHALRIDEVKGLTPGYGATMVPESPYTEFDVHAAFASKHDLSNPGYFLVLEDRRVSWSPKAEFEARFTLIEGPEKVTSA